MDHGAAKPTAVERVCRRAVHRLPYTQGVIKAMVDGTPLGRMGRPEEVSAVVGFLVSPGAGYINGQLIGLDGGFSA